MTQRLAVGIRAPACFGMTAARQFYAFEAQAGRPAILLLAGGAAAAGAQAILTALAAHGERLAAAQADLLLLTDDSLPSPCWRPVLAAGVACVDATRFLRDCGVGSDGLWAVVLDRGLTVAFAQDACEARAEAVAAACLACLATLRMEVARDILLPAPVLMLPHLLTRETCRALIDWFAGCAAMEGEVARVAADGRVLSVVDRAKKARFDAPLDPTTSLYAPVRAAVMARCGPAIAQAFAVRVRHADRFLVARYDTGAGWFARHRDNTAPHVAFRQFALSVNLDDDYDGGHLLFPEFSDHRHRPAMGEGIVFSASLLHAAAPVTRGVRHVLLTFLHDDAAEAGRQEYLAETLAMA